MSSTLARKRRYSISNSTPTKRTKTDCIDTPLEAIDPMHATFRKMSKELFRNKKQLMSGYIDKIQKLLSDATYSIDDFKRTFLMIESTDQGVLDKRNAFLLNFLSSIIEKFKECRQEMVEADNVPSVEKNQDVVRCNSLVGQASPIEDLRNGIDSTLPASSLVSTTNLTEKQSAGTFIESTDNSGVSSSCTIYECDEDNDDALSSRSDLSNKTVRNIILKEETEPANNAPNDFCSLRLCDKTGQFIDLESDNEPAIFGLSKILDSFLQLDSDVESLEEPTQKLFEELDTNFETVTVPNTPRLCEIEGSFIEQVVDVSDVVSDCSSYVFDIISTPPYDEYNTIEERLHISDVEEMPDCDIVNNKLPLDSVGSDCHVENSNENWNFSNINEGKDDISIVDEKLSDICDIDIIPKQEVDVIIDVLDDNDKVKLDFLEYCGLTGVKHTNDNRDSSIIDDEEIRRANQIIKRKYYDNLKDSSCSSLLSDDSYLSNEVFSESEDECGRITNILPALPRIDQSEVLKELKVVLKPLDLSTKRDKDEINRLTNLKSLESVTNRTVNISKKKYRKLTTKSHTANSESDENSVSYDVDMKNEALCDNVNSKDFDNYPMDFEGDFLNPFDNINEDIESIDVEENIKTNNHCNDSDKENKRNKSDKKELTAEEIQKAKWKNDQLLCGKLSDSDSDFEDGTKKKKRQLLKLTKSHTRDSDNETIPADNHILIESDSYDSEIEFVAVPEKKLSKSPDDIYSLDSDEDISSVKKGRKNIRPILSDDILEAATKKAVLIENKRKERLTQKHNSMDNFLSQVSTVQNQSAGLVLDFNEDTKQPIVVVNPKLTERLKPHQAEGVKFMWESCYESINQIRQNYGSGCILAHCMGLGKTFQVVTLIHTLFSHSQTNTKYVLVVCPLSIVLNWKSEFKIGLENVKDTLDIKVYVISDLCRTFEQKADVVLQWRQKSGVLILGYEAFQRLTKFKDPDKLENGESKLKMALLNPGPDLVVLDEGHLIKNGKINRTQALECIETKRRIVLTGTPLQNNLKEYYYMVQFVKPNLLGTYLEYSNRFANPIINGQFDDSTIQDIQKMKWRSHVLHKMLKDTIQRYEVAELSTYLPKRFDYALFIELHPLQIELYKKYIQLTSLKNKATTLFSNYHILQCLSSHPYLLFLKEKKKALPNKKAKEVDVIKLENDPDELIQDANNLIPDDWWKPIYQPDSKDGIEYGPKFLVMLSIIQESEKVNDKVLIFSSSLLELDAIEYFLKQSESEVSKWRPNQDYFRMDGSVSPETRLKLCNSFNKEANKRTRVFIISHKVGGLGLNLVAANRIILMDINWNPAIDNQSVFRSYRFGQTKKCYVYRLVAMGTMEQVVYDRQVNKSAIARRVVDEKQISRRYKREELEDMYKMKFHLYEAKQDPHVLPKDPVLKRILSIHKEILKYHEHNALLENRPDEQLDDAQMKLAWEEYNKEQELIEQQKRRPVVGPIENASLNAVAICANSAVPVSTTTLNYSTIPDALPSCANQPDGFALRPFPISTLVKSAETTSTLPLKEVLNKNKTAPKQLPTEPTGTNLINIRTYPYKSKSGPTATTSGTNKNITIGSTEKTLGKIHSAAARDVKSIPLLREKFAVPISVTKDQNQVLNYLNSTDNALLPNLLQPGQMITANLKDGKVTCINRIILPNSVQKLSHIGPAVPPINLNNSRTSTNKSKTIPPTNINNSKSAPKNPSNSKGVLLNNPYNSRILPNYASNLKNILPSNTNNSKRVPNNPSNSKDNSRNLISAPRNSSILPNNPSNSSILPNTSNSKQIPHNDTNNSRNIPSNPRTVTSSNNQSNSRIILSDSSAISLIPLGGNKPVAKQQEESNDTLMSLQKNSNITLSAVSATNDAKQDALNGQNPALSIINKRWRKESEIIELD